MKTTEDKTLVTLYTNDCPKCKILKTKLDTKNVQYDICNDLELMINKGFRSMPILEVDGKTFLFNDAVAWVNEVSV